LPNAEIVILERSEESGWGAGLMKEYYVYILSNQRGVLYTGVTNDLVRRVYQHKNKLIEGFTKRYNINQLVYFESYGDVKAAIEREKKIKGLLRYKKVDLIKTMNPRWDDLSAAWSGNQ
jgi:putative endonuclease